MRADSPAISLIGGESSSWSLRSRHHDHHRHSSIGSTILPQSSSVGSLLRLRMVNVMKSSSISTQFLDTENSRPGYLRTLAVFNDLRSRMGSCHQIGWSPDPSEVRAMRCCNMAKHLQLSRKLRCRCKNPKILEINAAPPSPAFLRRDLSDS